MAVTIHEAAWRTFTEGRTCGDCYACCVYLGIEELKKHTGQACKHLDGKSNVCGRCSIYARRPEACSTYRCMWLEGYGPDNLRPADSGILLTPYAPEMGGELAITMMVFDLKDEKFTQQAMTELLQLSPTVELRVVNFVSKTALLCVGGLIYNCKILPSKTVESLDFEADLDKPVGSYLTAKL